jgi:hypothetical protein
VVPVTLEPIVMPMALTQSSLVGGGGASAITLDAYENAIRVRRKVKILFMRGNLLSDIFITVFCGIINPSQLRKDELNLTTPVRKLFYEYLQEIIILIIISESGCKFAIIPPSIQGIAVEIVIHLSFWCNKRGFKDSEMML